MTDKDIRKVDIDLTTDPVLLDEILPGVVQGRRVGHPQVSLRVTNRFLMNCQLLYKLDPETEDRELPFFDMKIVVRVDKEDPRIAEMREVVFRGRRTDVSEKYERIDHLTTEIARMKEARRAHTEKLRQSEPIFRMSRTTEIELTALRKNKPQSKEERILIEEKRKFLEENRAAIDEIFKSNPYPYTKGDIGKAESELRRKQKEIDIARFSSSPWPETDPLAAFLEEKGIYLRENDNLDLPELFRDVQRAPRIFSVDPEGMAAENVEQRSLTIPFEVFDALKRRNNVVRRKGFRALCPSAQNVLGTEDGNEALLVYYEKEREEFVLLLPLWICHQILFNVEIMRGQDNVHRIIVETFPHWSHRNLNVEDRASRKETPELPMPSVEVEGGNLDEADGDDSEDEYVETDGEEPGVLDDVLLPSSSRADEETPVADASANATL